ncbi:hypothetical protein AB4212_40555, partial [Streptomyces sp. 2MCAF27]
QGAPAPAIRPLAGTPHPAPHPHPIPHPDPGTYPHPTGDGPRETPARPDGPHPAPNALVPRLGPDSRADAELYAQALALDAAARQSTGRPVSIRQLRRHLHLGQRRARELRTRLDIHRTPGAPTPHSALAAAPHQPTADPPVGVRGAA